jgi:hypothetical protein
LPTFLHFLLLFSLPLLFPLQSSLFPILSPSLFLSADDAGFVSTAPRAKEEEAVFRILQAATNHSFFSSLYISLSLSLSLPLFSISPTAPGWRSKKQRVEEKPVWKKVVIMRILPKSI